MEQKKANPADILYDKTYTCPVCQNTFKAKAIKSGKNRPIKTDFDLKTTYDIVNPSLYECIVCEMCGYAALNKNFNTLSSKQKTWIREQIVSKYVPTHYPEILTEKDGIRRFKMALLNSEVKHGKEGEKAYICLKIAWLYRDQKNEKMELEFLKNALLKFQAAFSSESFPIFGLDELTVAYIIATIHYRFGHYKDALQWLGNIIVSKTVSPRLKTNATNLKEQIRIEHNA